MSHCKQQTYQVIPDHGNRQKGRHCLKAIYLNLSELRRLRSEKEFQTLEPKKSALL